MKRAFAVVGFSMLGVLNVFCYIGDNNTAMSAAITASLIALLLSLFMRPLRRNGTLPTAFLAFFVALVILFFNNSTYYKNIILYADKEITVSGSLTDLPYKSDGNSCYIINADSIDGSEAHVGIKIVSSSPLDLEPTDRLTVTVQSYSLGSSGDEYLNYYKSKDLILGGYVTGDAVIEKGVCSGLYDKILLIRSEMSSAVMRLLPNDYGAVITGLTLGDKINLSDRASNAFRLCGVSHLFAVSGLHMSVWSMLFYRFSRKLRLSAKSSSVVSIFFCIFFIFLTGCNPPVVRSGVMMIMIYLSNLFSREAEAFNSIGLALSILLAFNPYCSTSLSLWLSLLATMGILLLFGKFDRILSRPAEKISNKILKNLLKQLASVTAVSAAVTVFTLPVYIISLKNVSLLLFVSNFLMVSAGTLCMETGGVAAVFLVYGAEAVGKFLLFVSGLLSKFLLKIALFLSQFRYALVSVDSNYSKIIIAVFLLCAAAGLILRVKNKRMIKRFCACFAALFIAVNSVLYFLNFNSLRICAADVGNGMSIVMTYKGETVILGCGGDYYAKSSVYDIINSYSINIIDYLVLPGSESSLTSEADYVLGRYTVKNLYLENEKNITEYSYDGNVITGERSVISLHGGEVTVALQNDSVCSAAQIYYKNFHCVISFSTSGTLTNASGDFLICRGKIPNGLSVNDFGTVVVSSDDTENIWQSEFAGNICSTADNGSIAFLVKPNGEISYRRML